jgi:hypothetical protein
MTDPWPVKGKNILEAGCFKWYCLSLVYGRHQFRISDRSTELGSPGFRQRLRTSYKIISQITAKFILEESTKAQGVSTGITLLFS